MNSKNKVGRPKGESQARQRLLEVATALFIELDYDRVSLRMIGKQAQLDPALIAYYFGSKAGLFGEMLSSVSSPVFATLQQVTAQLGSRSLNDLMRIYYQTMADNPHFPKLIFQLASMPGNHESLEQLNLILQNLGRLLGKGLFQRLAAEGSFAEGVDAELAQLSFMSLMVFPFLIPERLLQANHISLPKDKLLKLAEHNIALLARGLFKN
ncbi:MULTISPECIES: TetR/AcrR family transcriptional regulator [unclassified Agarivorans]|uniref:TetR/AcrR family transcriptional regulator n=1 Tax=unclassified Agarivorans TaxID=2636026 RepID=UPI003D7DE25C